MAVANVAVPSAALPRAQLRALPRSTNPNYAPWLPLACMLVGVVSLFYLNQTSEQAANSYDVRELQVELSNLKLQNDQLRLEVSKAKSLSSIEVQATGRMQMVPPKEVVYLRVPPAGEAQRANPSSRGEGRVTPALEKVEASSAARLLEPVRDSISSLLTPRTRTTQR